MFLRDLMLAFSRRTVHYRDMVRLGPGPQTPAEAPRHTHQVVVVQILIGTVERTPPNAKASSRLPHGKIGVAHHPIHAIITTFQKLAIKGAQLVRHGAALRIANRFYSSERNTYSHATATAPARAAPKGPLFRSAVSEKAQLFSGAKNEGLSCVFSSASQSAV